MEERFRLPSPGEVYGVEDFEREGAYDSWTRPVGPTDLTVEMPIPDYAKPPAQLGVALREHFEEVKNIKTKHPLDNEANFNEWLRTDQSVSYQTWLDRQLSGAQTQRIPRIRGLQTPVEVPRNDRQNFQEIAKSRVHEVVDAQFADLDEHPAYDLYIVWFCKTLQNWKALVCTTLEDEMYYEVTYNGDKRETYVDQYKKVLNSTIYDS